MNVTPLVDRLSHAEELVTLGLHLQANRVGLVSHGTLGGGGTQQCEGPLL